MTTDLNSYHSSTEILEAILYYAGDVDQEWNEGCHQLWEDPSDEQKAMIEERAWKLAPKETDTLYWGDYTITRPKD
jgi:hypothetical protein